MYVIARSHVLISAAFISAVACSFDSRRSNGSDVASWFASQEIPFVL